MFTLLAFHCHTGFSPTMHGLTEALESARSIDNRGTAILNALQQLSPIFIAEECTNIFQITSKEKSGGFRSSEQLVQDTGPCLPVHCPMKEV
jgi:hypothetical protein